MNAVRDFDLIPAAVGDAPSDSDHAEPVDRGVVSAQVRALDRIDGDVESGEIEKQLAEAITRILQILIPLRAKYLPPIEVGLNVIALAWVLNPAYFEGSPSLRKLARRCGVTPAALARHTAYYSRLIGWRNRAQRHAWNFEQRSPSGDDNASSRQGH